MNILSFGEVLWDVYPEGPENKGENAFIGGAPLNFAAHLALHGERACMLSAIGADELGKCSLRKLSELGVDASYVAVLADKPTGRCMVTLDEARVPKYELLTDVAYDHIDTDRIDEDFDVLYFGTLALRSRENMSSLERLVKRRAFGEIFVDVNIRAPFFSDESIAFAVGNATILKVSEEELDTVADALGIACEKGNVGEFARSVSSRFRGLGCVIVTRGGDGAYALDTASGLEYYCEGEKLEVVSTVGAGDSFSAAFLHMYLRREPMDLCLKYASAVAGYVVSHYEAIPRYDVSRLKTRFGRA